MRVKSRFRLTTKTKKHSIKNEKNINQTERKGPWGDLYWEVTINKVENSIKATKMKVRTPQFLKKQSKSLPCLVQEIT